MAAFTAAASLLAIAPNCEALDSPKEPLLAWIAILVALGIKSSDVSPWVGAGLYLGNGVMSYFFAEDTLKMYGCSGKISKLSVATQKFAGAMMLFTGAYLAALAAGKEPLEAFGITAALICAHVAIFVFHGAPDDYNKLPLAWLALFGRSRSRRSTRRPARHATGDSDERWTAASSPKVSRRGR